MSILAEGLGNDGGAHDHKGDHCDEHDRSQAKKVFGVLEQSLTFGRAKGTPTSCAAKAQ